MSRPVRDAVGVVRRRPALLLAGVAVAAVEAVGYLLVGRALASGRIGLAFVAPAVEWAVWILLAPAPLAGLYVLARDGLSNTGDRPDPDDRSALQQCVAAGRRWYGPLVAATVGYALAGLVAGLLLLVVLHAVGFALATGASAFYYLSGGGPSLHPAWSLLLSAALIALARVGGAIPFRFYDVLVVFGGDRPRTAALTSARFAVARPRATVRYAAVVVVLSVLPVLAAVAVVIASGTQVADLGAGSSPLVPTGALALLAVGVAGGSLFVQTAAALGTYLAVGGLAHALVGAYHVAFFERVVAPAVTRKVDQPSVPDATGDSADRRRATAGLRRRPVTGEERPLIGSPRRALLAALVVVGLLAGTTAVRVTDVGAPVPDADPRPVAATADPDDLLERAHGYTGRVSHRTVARSYAVDGDDRNLSIVVRRTVDFEDRQARVVIAQRGGSDLVGDGYFGDGTVALRGVVPEADELGGSARQSGEWTVVPAPGYPTVRSDLRRGYAQFDPVGDWTVVERTGDRVILAPADASTRERVLDLPTPADDERLVVGPETRVRAAVDRDAGYLRRLELRRNWTLYEGNESVLDRNTHTVVRFQDYGSTDLKRPEGVGERTLLEWLWDAAGY